MTATLVHPVNVTAELWHDELGTMFDGLQPEPLSTRAALRGRVEAASFGDVGAYLVTGSPQLVRRTRPRALGGRERLLKMCLQVRGSAVLHQDGRELAIRPGQLAVYDTSQAYELRLEGGWECAVMTFPLESLCLPTGWVHDVMTRTHDASRGPGSVLRSFVESAIAQHAEPAAAGLRFAEAGLSLLASTLCCDQRPDPGHAAAGDARRMQVMDHVRRHLRDPSLSHTSVAAALGMSPRSLDRLFEDEPVTVAAVIRAMRLEGARRDLADPRSRRSTIEAVASRWCFAQPAHFSRAFKAQFGISPRQAQHAVAVDHP